MAIAREQILAALQKLDVNNDGHWTADGLPRLETVRLFAGDQSLNRDAITAVASEFTRLAAYNAQQAAQVPPAPVAAATQEAQDVQAAAPPVANPVPEAPPVAAEVVQDVPVQEERSPLKQQLAEVQDELSQLDGYAAKLKKHRDQLILKKDDLIAAIQTETPNNSNQQDIMSYLASQNKLLEERRQRIEATKHVNLADFLPKRAPIDVAMGRRNTRGTNRPGR
jgi:hypothetical protein